MNSNVTSPTGGSQMLAYHGSQEIKDKYLDRIREHRRQEQLWSAAASLMADKLIELLSGPEDLTDIEPPPSWADAVTPGGDVRSPGGVL